MHLCQLSGWFLLWHVCFWAISPFVCGDGSNPSTERSLIINIHVCGSRSPVQSMWLLPRDGLVGLGMCVRVPHWKCRGCSSTGRWVFHLCWYSLLCLQRLAQGEKGKVVKMCNRTVSPINASLILLISCQNRGSPVLGGARRQLLPPAAAGLLYKNQKMEKRTADLVIIHYGRNGQFQDT